MRVFRDKWLTWQAGRWNKRGVRAKRLSRFSQVQKVGILYEYETLLQHQAVMALRRTLREATKQVETYCYLVNDPIDFPAGQVPAFRPEEIKFWGQVVDRGLLHFLAEPFDLLYVPNIQLSPVMHYVTARSVAACKVGVHAFCQLESFDLLLAPNSYEALTPIQVPQQLLQYTKLI